MEQLNQFYLWLSHPAVVAVLTLVASAAVDAMPLPASEGGFYRWLYGFAHTVMLHADKFKFELAVPSLQTPANPAGGHPPIPAPLPPAPPPPQPPGAA